MSIEGVPGGGGPAAAPVQESLGSRMNRMAGVQEKSLFEPKDKMGKDAFLKMFTEQLKNQNPLNPMANDQFSQQMAMFSQLEQQMTTNKNLEKMIAQQSNTQIAALQLVGKKISADRAALYVDKDKATAVQFKMPQDASDVKLQVLDPGGEVIKTLELGAQNQGDVKTKWDGQTEEGRPVESGRYSYKILAKGADGKDLTVTTKIDGKVTGVTSDKGTTYLLVGDQKVGLNDVEMISEADAVAPAMNVAPSQPGNGTQVVVNTAPTDGNAAGTKAVDSSAEESEPDRISIEDVVKDARTRPMGPDTLPVFFFR